MHRAIGELLPTALAVMLNPFPVIAMVLLMASARGRRRGAAFTCGWMLGLSAQMALVLTFTNSTDAADGTSSALVDWLRVVVGALMIVWAAKKWGSRPRPGEEVVLPNWMAKIESVGVLGAFLVGLGLAGVNPKNFALTMAAAASITDLVSAGHDSVRAAIVFVLLSSLSVVGILVFHVVGGSRATEPLQELKRFMVTNNAVLIMLVLLLLGAKILGDGLAALGS